MESTSQTVSAHHFCRELRNLEKALQEDRLPFILEFLPSDPDNQWYGGIVLQTTGLVEFQGPSLGAILDKLWNTYRRWKREQQTKTKQKFTDRANRRI